MVTRRLLYAVAGVCVVFGSGCTERILADTSVPAGFKLENTRPVAVSVTAGQASLRPGQVGGLELADADGKVLFRGPIRGGAPLQLKVALPRVQDTLRASLSSAGRAPRQANLSISAGAAAHQFE